MKKTKYLSAVLAAALTSLLLPSMVFAGDDISDINYVTIPVTKTWEHGDNEDKPDSVTIQLKNGNDVVDTVLLTADNADPSSENMWSGTFSPVPIKSESGNVIDYTVEEICVDGYDSTVEQPLISPFQITSFGNKVTPASNDTYSFSGNLIIANKGGDYCVWTPALLNEEETVILMDSVNRANLNGIGAAMTTSNTVFGSGNSAVYENKHGASVTVNNGSIHFSDENVWSLFYAGTCGYTLEKGASVINTHIHSETTDVPTDVITPEDPAPGTPDDIPGGILDPAPEIPDDIPEEAPEAPEVNVDETPEIPDDIEKTPETPEGITDKTPDNNPEKTGDPDVSISQENTQENPLVSNEAPKTGDSMNIILWIAIAGLSLSALITALLIKKHA